MSSDTKIQWTDHTFNPWWGCTKVHAGCKHCYAEATDKRWGGDHWGNGPRRMVLGEWSKPAKWNADAEKAGVRARVFCASMCDLFEDYDGPVVNQQGQPIGRPGEDGNWTVPKLRARVFDIITETPWLEWQLLTKRPENVIGMTPKAWRTNWPANVITGTSPCNQETFDGTITSLQLIPGRHFLSCEPLLGELNLDVNRHGFGAWSDDVCMTGIDWVIVGGESGRGARGCCVDWIRSIVRQCAATGVPCFVKQLGANPWFDDGSEGINAGNALVLKDAKGGDWNEWPKGLCVRQFPEPHP